MKSFSAFLIEAERSRAAQEAEKLRLTHVGYGRYANERGEVTHMSQDGKLVQLDPNNPVAPEQENGGEETGDGTGAVDQGTIAITFGRFNPPTIGHEALIKRVAREAKNGEYRIYPSRSQDPKKNPLDPGTKIKFMRKAYPEHANAIIANDGMRSIFDVLTALDSEGYSGVTLVVGGDRVSEFNSLANKYNGKLYNFETIDVVSAGERDPDSEGVEGMSASKLRKAAAEDDFKTFDQGMPQGLSKNDKAELYNTLRGSMQVESFDDFAEVSYDLHEVAPKLDPDGLREEYYNGRLFRVGTVVENINTGIVGTVVTRGSNYVIYVDESENIFRSWLRDLQEVNNIKLFDFTPAGEMGTDELADYMRRLTPGEFLKKINKKDKTAE